MIKKSMKVGAWILAMILLRSVAIFVTDSSPHFSHVKEKGLDPSLMFYTESEEALAAEKEIGHKTSKSGNMPNNQ